MYNIWQIVKPNGEKLAWLDEEQALTEAIEWSQKVGADQVIYLKLECEEDEGDQPGKEFVVETKVFSNGNVISENTDRYEAPSYVPAPSKSKKKGGAGLTPEQKAAKEQEAAEKKAKRDAEKAQRQEAKAAAKAERDAAREARKAQRELDKANRPQGSGPRSRLPDDGIIHMLRDSNPKRPGSAAHPRFDLYQEGMSVKEYKTLNKDFGSMDLAWDIEHGFIRVTKADGSPLDTATPVPVPAEPEAEQVAAE